MNPVPLHPALVHAPLALAVALPLIGAAVSIALARGGAGRRTWWAVVGLQALLVAGTWVAMETGENEEHRVERVTGEAPVETHEHHAKTLLKGAGASLVLGALAGAAPAVLLPLATFASTAGSGVVAWLAIRTGQSGGELVYVHGAGAAYATQAKLAARPAAKGAEQHDEHERYR